MRGSYCLNAPRITCQSISPGNNDYAQPITQLKAQSTLSRPNTARLEASTSTLNSNQPSSKLHIRPATLADYWGISDMHCSAFYPTANSFWSPLLRVDRVLSLHVGSERTGPGRGEFACLIAADDGATSSNSNKTLGPIMDTVVKSLFPPSFQENYCANHIESGIKGAIIVDTLAEHLPPKTVIVSTGVVREVRRTGIAYISNLAVSPRAQRQGIGLQLLEEAERLAKEWGCRSVALHVDVTNTPAKALYTSAGYKCAGMQPEWQRFMEMRSHPLMLMLKVLPTTAK